MRKILIVLPILLVSAGPISAQSGLTGTWEAEMSANELWTLELRVDGTSLTGTVGGNSTEPRQIYDAHIAGNTAVFSFKAGERTITFTGTVAADEIAFTYDTNGVPVARQYTAKRVPDGRAPLRTKGAPFLKRLAVYNRTGQPLRTVEELGNYWYPTLSPDGTRVAVRLRQEIWTFDLATAKGTQVSSTAVEGFYTGPVWSPDAKHLAFFSHGTEVGLYRKAADGSGREERLYDHKVDPDAETIVTDWSPDGRFLAFYSGDVLWVVRSDGVSDAMEILREEYGAFGARFSPDSRFLAYTSNESGRNEVYVQSFDPALGFKPGGGKWKVSTEGGLGLVQWRQDGRELYYLAADGGVMAVPVATTPTFKAGQPTLLFRAPGTFRLADVNPPNCGCGMGCEQASFSRSGDRFVFAITTPPARKEVSVASRTLTTYTGTYFTSTGGENVITLEANQLMIRFPTGMQQALVAESETYFHFKDTNGDIEFFTDDKGAVTHFLRYSGGPAAKHERK